MEFIDLGRQYAVIKDKIDDGIKSVIDSHHFIMGDEITQLESRLCDFVGRKYCLTCGSGTEALLIPLMAYELKKTDAIFVPAFTFFASAESVSVAGGTPIFVDSDQYFNMDPDSLEEQINRIKREGKLNPRGIIPVDLFGRSANYDKIINIAIKNDLFVLEDAAQGFGGALHGNRNGSFGDVSATSFFPAKPLGCYGDGGAIFTDNEDLYNKMKSIRIHGAGNNRYDNVRLGINGRMDTIQAAVVMAKLDIFERELQQRQIVAQWYYEELSDYYDMPKRTTDYYSAWAQLSILAKNHDEREKIISKMSEKNIPIMVYYPVPLHKQTVYINQGYGKVTLPVCEDYARRIFSVPMHPYLKQKEVKYISNCLKEIII